MTTPISDTETLTGVDAAVRYDGVTIAASTTITTGTHTFPASGGTLIADDDTVFSVTLDRQGAAGFTNTPAVACTLEVDQSNDGGVTWVSLGACSFPGGVIGDHGTDLLSGFSSTLQPGTGRRVRAVITLTGGTVALGPAGGLVRCQ